MSVLDKMINKRELVINDSPSSPNIRVGLVHPKRHMIIGKTNTDEDILIFMDADDSKYLDLCGKIPVESFVKNGQLVIEKELEKDEIVSLIQSGGNIYGKSNKIVGLIKEVTAGLSLSPDYIFI